MPTIHLEADQLLNAALQMPLDLREVIGVLSSVGAAC